MNMEIIWLAVITKSVHISGSTWNVCSKSLCLNQKNGTAQTAANLTDLKRERNNRNTVLFGQSIEHSTACTHKINRIIV